MKRIAVWAGLALALLLAVLLIRTAGLASRRTAAAAIPPAAHGTDERLALATLAEGVRFYRRLIERSGPAQPPLP